MRAARSKNDKNRAITFVAFCLHEFIMKMACFDRSCGGAPLEQIPPKGFEVWCSLTHSNELSKGFALLAKIQRGFAPFVQIATKTPNGFTLLAKVRKGFAFSGTLLPTTRRGSHFWRRFAKGSHVCANRSQIFERVHTFGEGS